MCQLHHRYLKMRHPWIVMTGNPVFHISHDLFFSIGKTVLPFLSFNSGFSLLLFLIQSFGKTLLPFFLFLRFFICSSSYSNPSGRLPLLNRNGAWWQILLLPCYFFYAFNFLICLFDKAIIVPAVIDQRVTKTLISGLSYLVNSRKPSKIDQTH